MSTTPLRIALDAGDFPFLYRDASRGVINAKNWDQVGRVGRNNNNVDWNAPHVLYAENILPTSHGVVTTDFKEIIPPISASYFDQAIVLRDFIENNSLFVPANGANYVLNILTGEWSSVHPFSFINKLVTRGYTQGRTFVFYEKQKLFEYDGPGNTLTDRTSDIVLPAGFSITDIRGIGGASNYLLLFTDIDILWSSPTDPLNFNRSLFNGSGYQIPEDVRGQISCVLPVAGGAIIYTLRNAVAAIFTNNATTPFLFRGITNAGGVAGYEQVAYDADEKYQYVWGSGGLQQVSLQAAESVFPEVSDFLTAGRYEWYDYTTHAVVEEAVSTYFSIKLTYVAQRYLIISYGTTPGTFTYALVLDTAIGRWGKVRIDHVDCFSYPYPNIVGDLEYQELFVDYTGLGDTTYEELGVGIISIAPPKKTIAFLQKTGSISVLIGDYSVRTNGGVVIVGQLAYSRERFTTLHEVELEGVQDANVYALVSVDGKTTNRVVQYLAYEAINEYRMHYGDEVGKSINVAIEGVMQLTGFLCRVAAHGRY